MLGQGTYLIADASMRQTVSPQLVAQSEILELSADELWERIQQELQENPALEIADEAPPHPLARNVPVAALEAPEALEGLRAPYTLADDLRLQLAHVPAARRAICEYLVDCLDERGFLDVEVGALAGRFAVSVFEVEAAVQVLQSLEPVGIGARSLRECLLLQVRRFPAAEVPAHTEDFINAYLQTIRRQSPAQAAAFLNLTDRQLAEILTFIGEHLYMWPADRFRDEVQTGADTLPVFPDASISDSGGRLQVRVTQSWARSLRVSEAYARLDNDWRRATSATSLAERERLAEKVRTAQAFIHYLTRREAVLRRVTEAIVSRQEAFFREGATALQPLTRKEIAATLRVHESTISRVTRAKYLQLPDERLVPFDFFFDGSLSAKEELRDLIAAEERTRPLSDGALTALMVSRGHVLARRTVAKYRDALGIPPAHQRRCRAAARPSHLEPVPAVA
jgi:RNA polymerase sigma-54 factor